MLGERGVLWLDHSASRQDDRSPQLSSNCNSMNEESSCPSPYSWHVQAATAGNEMTSCCNLAQKGSKPFTALSMSACRRCISIGSSCTKLFYKDRGGENSPQSLPFVLTGLSMFNIILSNLYLLVLECLSYVKQEALTLWPLYWSVNISLLEAQERL